MKQDRKKKTDSKIAISLLTPCFVQPTSFDFQAALEGKKFIGKLNVHNICWSNRLSDLPHGLNQPFCQLRLY